MTNNDVLRRLRYSFDFNDDKVMALFSAGGYDASRAEISDWLKKDDDPAYKAINDTRLATFLNGLIIARRGKKDESTPKPEKRLSNNLILRKLNIALNLKSEAVLELLASVGFELSKHELSALFRKPGHKHYRECKDQILRHYLKALQLKYRIKPQSAAESESRQAPTPGITADMVWSKAARDKA